MDFETWLQQEDRAEKTTQGYVSDVSKFAAWFMQTNGKPLTPDALTPTDIREYRAWLQRQGRKPATVNRHLMSIRSYGKWAMETGLAPANPAQKIKLVQQAETSPKWLTKKEQFSLARHAEEAVSRATTEPARRQASRDLAIIHLLMSAGLRVGELCALTTHDIEISPKKGKVVVRQGKGNKWRTVPLSNEARKSLAAWLIIRPDLSEVLFLGSRGDRMTPSGVHRRLTELGRLANVNVHAHALRHTFAKNLINSGVGLEKVAALLGHDSLDTTRVYVTPGEEELEEAVGRLSH